MNLEAEVESLRRENAELREHLATRKLVERAKGLLMKCRRLSERQAFRLLQKTSMDTRQPMAEVALAVIRSAQTAVPLTSCEPVALSEWRWRVR